MILKYSKLQQSLSPYDSGWLSPSGDFFELGEYASHWDLAEKIVKEEGIEPIRSAQETLLLNDWIRIAGSSAIVPIISFEFAGDINKIKPILKRAYPTYYGKVFIDKDSKENLDKRLYFEGTMDEFMRWSGNRSVVSSKKKKATEKDY